MDQLSHLHSWSSLSKHAKETHLTVMNYDKSNFKLVFGHVELDFSYQKISQKTLDLLLSLARECDLKGRIKTLQNGGLVNYSQGIPALHTALRDKGSEVLLVNGRNIIPDVLAVREQMCGISEQVRAGTWLGYSGKPVTSIVNIGMGGSDFGPRFCIDALSEFTAEHLDYHFISDADPKSFKTTVKKLNPETTLFIVSSKSFTTYETLYNARKALEWVGNPLHRDKHFIAITANVERAKEFGIANVLPIWDWVGGRYSLCSAINLITCIAIGYDSFSELLAGAHSMDTHFFQSELRENMPVMLALLGIWNINFLQASSLLMLVYARQLELLVPYVQQLDMESNGKSISDDGQLLEYGTGPIVWGGVGNHAQHSYYQLLCQSTHKIAADFISLKEYDGEKINSFCNEKIRI
jgi:glucose-6-phosphate isomerase